MLDYLFYCKVFCHIKNFGRKKANMQLKIIAYKFYHFPASILALSKKMPGGLHQIKRDTIQLHFPTLLINL